MRHTSFTDTVTWFEFSRDGSALHSRMADDLLGYAVSPTHDNGFYRTYYAPDIQYNSSQPDQDTTIFVIPIGRTNTISAAGTTNTLRRTVIGDAPQFGARFMSMVFPSPVSGMHVVAVPYDMGNSYHVELVKIDENGTLDWSLSLGPELGALGPFFYPNEPVVFDYSPGSMGTITIDQNETIYLQIHTFDNAYYIGIRPDGSIKFAKRYEILPISSVGEDWQFIPTTTDGFWTVANKYVQGLGNFSYFLKCDTLGSPLTLSRVEFGQQVDYYSSMGITSDSTLALTSYRGVLKVPNQGNTAVYHQSREFSDGSFVKRHSIEDATLKNDTLVTLGGWTVQDLFLGTMTRSMSMARTPISSFDQCVWRDTMLTRADIPTSLVVTTDLMPSMHFQYTTPHWTYSPDTLGVQFLSTSDPVMIDRCSVFTGVEEQTGELEALSLFPSPVAGNGTLHVEATTGTLFRILDLTGRSVLAGRPVRSSNPWSIPLPGLKPGLYLLELIDATGARTGTGRFLVE